MDVQELQRLLAEERRLRMEAEGRAQEAEAKVQPQTLQQYLEACHSLHLMMEVVTKNSLTTKGTVSIPTGRIFPRRIIPWKGFASKQQEVWDQLSSSSSFGMAKYPSEAELGFAKRHVRGITSEAGLRLYETFTLEGAVENLLGEANGDALLRSRLGINGTVEFEGHLNLGDAAVEATEDTSPAGRSDEPVTPPPKCRKARGKGNLADQFCVLKGSNGQSTPVLAIEYKAPHKLSVDTLATGLSSEIQPERDVIHKDESVDSGSAARRLSAVIVTQLFSYMIGKGLQYGYVCTGQAFVFCHIPEDSSQVYVSLCVPQVDVMDNEEKRLQRSAVAQVLAFTVHAVGAKPPSAEWHDKADKLGLWAVEYDDVLKDIPETVRKRKAPYQSPYKAQRWQGCTRSPVRTRSVSSRQRATASAPSAGFLETGSRPLVSQPLGDTNAPPSPAPGPSASGPSASSALGHVAEPSSPVTRPSIESRQFCTHDCLLSLSNGGAVDKSCPNAQFHGQKPLSRDDFLRLIRHQLATERGNDADCVPMYQHGSRGSLFKVSLSSHGYTMVAKGMEGLDHAHLKHENDIYDRLQPIQGKQVPVCLGLVDLVLPWYYDCGVFVHFLFLSWAGTPLFACQDPAIKADIAGAVRRVLSPVHKLKVLHRDAEPRNILYDKTSGRLMVIDFERSEFCGRQPLGPINKNRKRKREVVSKDKKREFDREMNFAVGQALLQRSQ